VTLFVHDRLELFGRKSECTGYLRTRARRSEPTELIEDRPSRARQDGHIVHEIVYDDVRV
jgi:hypothetical protein